MLGETVNGKDRDDEESGLGGGRSCRGGEALKTDRATAADHTGHHGHHRSGSPWLTSDRGEGRDCVPFVSGKEVLGRGDSGVSVQATASGMIAWIDVLTAQRPKYPQPVGVDNLDRFSSASQGDFSTNLCDEIFEFHHGGCCFASRDSCYRHLVENAVTCS